MCFLQQKRQFGSVAGGHGVPARLRPALKGPIRVDGAPVGFGNQEYTFPQAFFFPDLDSLFGKHEGLSIEWRERRLAFSQGYELVPRDFAGLKERRSSR